MHGTNLFTKAQIRGILTRIHAHQAVEIGNNLIAASIKIGTLGHIDNSDSSPISTNDEFGPVIDQHTQVCGHDIDDVMLTVEMSQWDAIVEVPQLTLNESISKSNIKPQKVKFNKKAFMNYTKISIPEDVAIILSMGPKFAVPVHYKPKDFQELKDAALELNDAYGNIYERNEVRANIFQLVQDYQKKGPHPEHNADITQFFNAALINTRMFLKENPDIVVTQADKARATILMDRSTYTAKIENLLRDRSTYIKLKSSSIAAYMKINEGLLIRLESTGWITRADVIVAVESENSIANLYALIKTHKKGTPPRPIVNTRRSMGFLASEKVTKILTRARDTTKYNVINSKQAVEKIRAHTIAPDEKFYSFDIVSMFTNIPVDRAMNAVIKRQQQLRLNNDDLKLVIDVIKFVCITSTEIKFNNQVFKQVRGLRMGSSLSPILADFVVEDMLDSAFKHIERPKLLIKYVDDILTIIEEEKADEMLTSLNELDEHIKFEMEKEQDHCINYLDFTVINKQQDDFRVRTKWYQKHIASGQFLNYHSQHPQTVIINTAIAYVTTMILNTSPEFYQEILDTARDRLTRNSFPTTVTNRIITSAKEKIACNVELTQNSSTGEDDASFYTKGLNYIPGLTGKLRQEVEKSAKRTEDGCNITIPQKPIYKMSKEIYNKHKDSNTMQFTQSDKLIDITQ